jgi:hypothetical protein
LYNVYVSLYSTLRKGTSYNNIGTPRSAGRIATAKTSSTAGRPEIARMKGTAEMPKTILTPTTHNFSQKFAKKSSERRKFGEKIKKTAPFFV